MAIETELEWLESTAQTFYPFADDPGPADPANRKGLLVDIAIVHNDPNMSQLALTIAYVCWTDGAEYIVLMDELYNTYAEVDGTATATGTTLGDYYIVQMLGTTYAGYPINVVMVFDKKHPNFGTGFEFFGGGAIVSPLVTSTCEYQGARVNSIEALAVQMQDTVELVEGYNIQLEVNPADLAADDSIRQKNRIRLTAKAGAGAGVVPVSCDDPALTSINGVPPSPEGDFILADKACYWLERPLAGEPALEYGNVWGDYTAETTPAALTIHNTCAMCCSCDQYETVYNDLKCMIDHAVLTGEWFTQIRDEMQEQMDVWASTLTCQDTCMLDIRLAARRDWYIRIQAVLANNKGCAIPGVCLEFGTASESGSAPEYEPETGFIYTDASQGRRQDPVVPVAGLFRFKIPEQIQPGGYAIVSFDVRIPIPRQIDDKVAVAVSLCDTTAATCGSMTKLGEAYLLGPRNKT